MDKVFLILVLAAMVIGPTRLPEAARQVGAWTRRMRDALDSARERVETESGVTLTREEWERLDPRRYDPRTIIRDALSSPVSTAQAADAGVTTAAAAPAVVAISVGAAASTDAAAGRKTEAGLEAEETTDASLESVAADEPSPPSPRRQKWVVVGGTSGHPIRRLVDIDEEPATASAT
ncbi:Sec-independent protein translocase subunit TatA/TatB [Demequina litorisediminis]|nr:twin-arginine translocase TatA/TatE family subunit [Demequina litorisediminis]